MCNICGGETNVECKKMGDDAYEYCPLCGSDSVDVSLRK